ncbi:Vacuolar protein sorting-associated protein 54 [Sparganum proliferum]
MPLRRHPSGEVPTPPSPSATDPATIIPSIFLVSDCDLANLQTFHRVIPLHPRGSTSQRHQQTSNERCLPSDQSPAPISQSAAFSSQNERLSQYLDTVELRIIKHVSELSSAFLEAVRGHDVVLSQTLADVRAAKEKLGQLDGIYCETAAQITRLEPRRANYKRLLKQFQLVASVHSTQTTIQSLLKFIDFCAALDIVSFT